MGVPLGSSIALVNATSFRGFRSGSSVASHELNIDRLCRGFQSSCAEIMLKFRGFPEAAAGGSSTTLLCKAELNAIPCGPVSILRQMLRHIF
uniref:Uncharacterized protein n=1 Tax=Physcomitrium patens TaxID=3218 RepID=A0A7I3ZLB5_PHYPA